MDLIKIIAEIHTLTTGIYYKQLQELLDCIIETPYKDIKKYKIVCKEVVYRECKKIGEHFNIEVIISNYLPENLLIAYINLENIKPDLTNYIL